MTKEKLLLGAAFVSLPLIVGGLAIGSAPKPTAEQKQQVSKEGYVCPVTGEELPCQGCCPLNGK